MPTLLIEHSISDFGLWHHAFMRFAARRKRAAYFTNGSCNRWTIRSTCSSTPVRHPGRGARIPAVPRDPGVDNPGQLACSSGQPACPSRRGSADKLRRPTAASIHRLSA